MRSDRLVRSDLEVGVNDFDDDMDVRRAGEDPRSAGDFLMFFAAGFFFFATGLLEVVFLLGVDLLDFFVFFRPAVDRALLFIGFFRFVAIVPLLLSPVTIKASS